MATTGNTDGGSTTLQESTIENQDSSSTSATGHLGHSEHGNSSVAPSHPDCSTLISEEDEADSDSSAHMESAASREREWEIDVNNNLDNDDNDEIYAEEMDGSVGSTSEEERLALAREIREREMIEDYINNEENLNMDRVENVNNREEDNREVINCDGIDCQDETNILRNLNNQEQDALNLRTSITGVTVIPTNNLSAAPQNNVNSQNHQMAATTTTVPEPDYPSRSLFQTFRNNFFGRNQTGNNDNSDSNSGQILRRNNNLALLNFQDHNNSNDNGDNQDIRNIRQNPRQGQQITFPILRPARLSNNNPNPGTSSSPAAPVSNVTNQANTGNSEIPYSPSLFGTRYDNRESIRTPCIKSPISYDMSPVVGNIMTLRHFVCFLGQLNIMFAIVSTLMSFHLGDDFLPVSATRSRYNNGQISGGYASFPSHYSYANADDATLDRAKKDTESLRLGNDQLDNSNNNDNSNSNNQRQLHTPTISPSNIYKIIAGWTALNGSKRIIANWLLPLLIYQFYLFLRISHASFMHFRCFIDLAIDIRTTENIGFDNSRSLDNKVASSFETSTASNSVSTTTVDNRNEIYAKIEISNHLMEYNQLKDMDIRVCPDKLGHGIRRMRDITQISDCSPSLIKLYCDTIQKLLVKNPYVDREIWEHNLNPAEKMQYLKIKNDLASNSYMSEENVESEALRTMYKEDRNKIYANFYRSTTQMTIWYIFLVLLIISTFYQMIRCYRYLRILEAHRTIFAMNTTTHGDGNRFGSSGLNHNGLSMAQVAASAHAANRISALADFISGNPSLRNHPYYGGRNATGENIISSSHNARDSRARNANSSESEYNSDPPKYDDVLKDELGSLDSLNPPAYVDINDSGGGGGEDEDDLAFEMEQEDAAIIEEETAAESSLRSNSMERAMANRQGNSSEDSNGNMTVEVEEVERIQRPSTAERQSTNHANGRL